MAYKYCTDCGSRVEYVGSLPKFCSDCGEALAGAVKRVVKGSIANKKISLKEDETDIMQIPNIRSLQYEVDPMDAKTFNLMDIVGANSPGARQDHEDAPNVEERTEKA